MTFCWKIFKKGMSFVLFGSKYDISSLRWNSSAINIFEMVNIDNGEKFSHGKKTKGKVNHPKRDMDSIQPHSWDILQRRTEFFIKY